MLFDLRTRGRRRTVQVIYAFLALIMLSGLLLVGVGTGSGGGILNAFTNNGSGGNSGAVKSAAVKQADKLVKADPSSASAWDQLIQAQWAAYNGLDTVKAAKAELTDLTQSYQHYLTLTKTPDQIAVLLASHSYALLGNFSQQAAARELFANDNPTDANAFECWAAAAYAAKDTTLANEAAAKAVTLVPKAQQFELKQQLNAAKSSTTEAEECE